MATVDATAGRATEDPSPIRIREAMAMVSGLAENLARKVPQVARDHTKSPRSMTLKGGESELGKLDRQCPQVE